MSSVAPFPTAAKASASETPLLRLLPASVRSPRRSAAKRLPRPSRSRTAHSFTIPRERLTSIFAEPRTPNLDRLLAEAGQQARQHQARSAELNQVVEAITTKATTEQWSLRKLAEHLGIPARSWARIIDGTADVATWLPRLRLAAARLNQPLPTPS